MSFIVFFFIFGLVIAVLSSCYFGYLDSATPGTVGKRVLKIRVIDHRTGQAPSFGMALLRMLIFGFLFDLCYIPGIVNALWPLWGENGRALHDMATNTQIVEVS